MQHLECVVEYYKDDYFIYLKGGKAKFIPTEFELESAKQKKKN